MINFLDKWKEEFTGYGSDRKYNNIFKKKKLIITHSTGFFSLVGTKTKGRIF